MLYATMQEMLITLSPADERELLVLVGRAVAREHDTGAGAETSPG